VEQAIRDPELARRLARTIVSDLSVYHKADVERGVREDNLFASMASLIEEGRRHYETRVHPELFGRGLYEKALVDFLLKPFGRVETTIW
jgi:hypothetical protein